MKMKNFVMAKSFAVVFSMTLFFPICAEAGGSTGLITRLFVHSPNSGYTSSSHGVVMFSAGTMTDASPCNSVGQWAFSLGTLTGRAMYDLLLYAANKNKTVIVKGTGNCSAWADRETVYFISINAP
jgi:hypothetical protein